MDLGKAHHDDVVHDGSPPWLEHLRAAHTQSESLPHLRAWLAERLATEPEAARRIPRFRRLLRLNQQTLQQELGREDLFRVPLPKEADAALLPVDSHWTVFLREGLDPRDERHLFLHALGHRLMGHLRDGDTLGHWDLLQGRSCRWDREVDELLQSPTAYTQQHATQHAAEPDLVTTAAQRYPLPLLSFLEDLPTMDPRVPFAPDLLPFTPWPHQVHVAQTILDTFPCRRLLCDEVGLGKTIETGLAIRELVHRGLVRRCLLLVPASVQTQWREELLEKFNLDFAPMPDRGDPWSGEFLLRIASSHLVRRTERRQALLQTEPWDLVIVDEAHHARRGSDERPNRMLQLLQGVARRTRGLLLLTATPLQLRLQEVADLLALLGETGDLERHFELLAQPVTRETWRELRPHLEAFGAEVTPREERVWRRSTGEVMPRRVARLLEGQEGAEERLSELTQSERGLLRDLLRRRTPLQRRMFRHTRALLRKYREAGLLEANIPVRDLEDCFVPLSPSERAVYDALEEHFRAVSDEARRLLGQNAVRVEFLLDLYRRRLTSSLHAIALSLGRRAARLAATLGRTPEALHPALADLPRQGEEEEPDEEETLQLEEDEPAPEQAELVRFELAGLAKLAPQVKELLDQGVDSKRRHFLDDLRVLLDCHDKVLVFTQFTDTLDDLREAVRPLFRPGAVGCYSGRGGEVWRDGAWTLTTKEEIKTRFRAARDLQVLLCTDAASEGLNFQTCGVLVNYDMPWNPMRAEQRIGRIDRIGQLHPVLQIRNYYYEDSIEGRVYQKLEERIGLFHEVVGPLQPILAAVTERLREAARAGGADGARLAERTVEDLSRQAGEEVERAPLIDPDLEDPDLPTPPPSPRTVRPGDLAALLGASLEPGSAPGRFRFSGVEGTFDPAAAEEGAALVTPGHPLHAALVSRALAAAGSAWPDRVTACRAALAGARRAAWPLGTLEEVAAALLDPAAAPGTPSEEQARVWLVGVSTREQALRESLIGADRHRALRMLLELVALEEGIRGGAESGWPQGTLLDYLRARPALQQDPLLHGLMTLALPLLQRCRLGAEVCEALLEGRRGKQLEGRKGACREGARRFLETERTEPPPLRFAGDPEIQWLPQGGRR